MSTLSSRWIDVGGVDTHYHECGTGEPVVFVHGSGPGVSAQANWGDLLEDFGTDRRAIALDCPGFGRSGRVPAERYSMPFWIEHFTGFLDALELQQVTLVGNSFGGSLSLAVAASSPARVRRLVLMGTPCGRFPITPGLRAGRLYDGRRESLGELLRMFPADPSLVDEAMIESRWQECQAPGALDAYRSLVPLAVASAESGGELSGVPEKIVARLRPPTLEIHVLQDAVIPVELGMRIHRAIPGSEFHSFEGCGHWAQLERRDRFVQLATQFLGANA